MELWVQSDVMACDLVVDEEVVGFKMDVKGGKSPTWKIAARAVCTQGIEGEAGRIVAPGVVWDRELPQFLIHHQIHCSNREPDILSKNEKLVRELWNR